MPAQIQERSSPSGGNGLLAIGGQPERGYTTTHKKLLCTGAVGSVIAAICCFTPALVIVLGAVGLSAWLGWLDYVLLPVLAIFIAITVYALYMGTRRPKGVDKFEQVS